LLPQEDGNELVHAGVGEEQVGRVRQETRGRHEGVAFGFKKIEEILPDLAAGACSVFAHNGCFKSTGWKV
jgi:hypothetical protein